jgi:hypothetical protein
MMGQVAKRLDNAYIVNVTEKEVDDDSQLQYTQLQILAEKQGSIKIPIEEIKMPAWKNLIKILKRD